MSNSKGALDFLSIYDDGESSDDDVPGCNVSTKRCLKEAFEEEKPNKRLQIRLPVPNLVINQVNLNPVPLDDPKQHDGRIRSFPHERGNWATYVYIPYESNSFVFDLANTVINHVPTIKLQLVDDFHISLTKTVVLRYHWIDLFIQSVKENLLSLKRFVIFFDTLEVYCNEERTRTFVGLKVATGINTIVNIVQKLDSCLEEFKLSKFYKFPSFHMSVVWCAGDYEKVLKNVLSELNALTMETRTSHPDTNYLLVDKINCKTGNKIFTFNLQ
ncbi:U6 snRNA phosphodiesterase [Agrilus planipennis]|uniref:U6 snRNA phosphodiesterase n=1 Tax=Agrilus planipennis TaxID=224129 RepID=A0A1W4WWV0_AGRPL|nr:U6 snRNA phosphodiesterase [Agrilus planipennis]